MALLSRLRLAGFALWDSKGTLISMRFT